MPFTHSIPTTQLEALQALSAPRVLPVAGSTDLVPCVEEGILSPEHVVDIRRIPGMRDVTRHADGSITIGAAVTIAELAEHKDINTHFAALARACESVGTPALRNSGTIGGNLVQRHHCWYFRRDVGCFKRGGSACAAVDGENQYHGILNDGTCRAVHPSDPAVALLALGATVHIAKHGAATRTVDIAELYAGAANDPHKEAQISHGELITSITLPQDAADGQQVWEKVMQRGAWDFALVSCAAVKRRDGVVRLAMGGLSLGAWRVPESIEEDVASGGLDEDSIDALVQRAFYDMEPLSGNEYKREMGQAVLKRSIGLLT